MLNIDKNLTIRSKLAAKIMVTLAMLLPSAAALAGPMSATLNNATQDVDTTPWYEINLVVFYQPAVMAQSEQWKSPELLNLDFPNNLIALDLTPWEPDVAQNAAIPFRPFEPTDEEFNKALSRLNLSRSYDIIYRKSWRQPTESRTGALPILIQGGKRFGDYFELEGTIALHVSRYLHLSSDLRLHKYVEQIAPSNKWWNEEENQSAPTNNTYTPVTETAVPNYVSIRTVRLLESRRMRSGELHYLDHPIIGIMVKVVPYERPLEPEPEAVVETLVDALPTTESQSAQPAKKPIKTQ